MKNRKNLVLSGKKGELKTIENTLQTRSWRCISKRRVLWVRAWEMGRRVKIGVFRGAWSLPFSQPASVCWSVEKCCGLLFPLSPASSPPLLKLANRTTDARRKTSRWRMRPTFSPKVHFFSSPNFQKQRMQTGVAQTRNLCVGEIVK